jgi:hypothetical protein
MSASVLKTIMCKKIDPLSYLDKMDSWTIEVQFDSLLFLKIYFQVYCIQVQFVSLILLEFSIMLASILAFCGYFFLKQTSYACYPIGASFPVLFDSVTASSD